MFTSDIPSIQNYDVEMRKSIRDKMFFIDHFDADIYVDYGCADGALFEFLTKVYPNKTFIGYDISEDQLKIARDNFLGSANVFFTSDWQKVVDFVEAGKNANEKSALILNSIIHEVYSYADDDSSINEFWDRVVSTGFDFVSIRDMALDPATIKSHNSFAPDVKTVTNSYDAKRLQEFTANWGPLSNKKNFIHFLLKYRYVQNWDREVKENYLPIDLTEIWNILTKDDKYTDICYETFQVPFIMNKIFEDFDMSFDEHTHFKMVLQLDTLKD